MLHTKIISRISNGFRGVKKVYKEVSDPTLSTTYFPEAERKNKFAVWVDLMRWLIKHNEVNELYFTYGLDRRDADAKEIMPYWKVNALRNSRNLHPKGEVYNYVCLMRDKFVFAQFLSSLQFPTPKNIALFNKHEVTWLPSMKKVPLSSLYQDETINVDGFAKKLSGIMGEGVFPLNIKNGRFYSGTKEMDLNQLQATLEGDYILQERIVQHQKMSELHPGSVNTLRIITFNTDGEIQLFSTGLRIGVGEQHTDNWGTGSIVVRIDRETGKLEEQGVFKQGYGLKAFAHPDTGVVFKDYEIPFFNEAVQMVSQLHSILPGIHSVGWDVAITEDGPTIIEGNDNWGCGIPMVLEKDFKSRLLKMYQSKDTKHTN